MLIKGVTKSRIIHHKVNVSFVNPKTLFILQYIDKTMYELTYIKIFNDKQGSMLQMA